MIFLNKNIKELELKSSYEAGQDDPVGEFYVPVLKCATSYGLITGFSSSGLETATKT